jgi:CRISPR-associated protein Cst1
MPRFEGDYSVSSIIRFTGDPFVDTGAAVLEYRLKKPANEISRADSQRQAAELEEIYSRKAWSGFLSVIFPNSCWCNPTMSASSREQQRLALLDSFDWPALPGRTCCYCERPAQHVADRSTVPMLTGATVMTAGAWGRPGLPVCSACQYAIQFYPLATLKVQGRPLFWWTPHHDWMFALTEIFAIRVDQLVTASPDGMPNLSWPSTRLLETAEEVLQQANAHEALPAVDLVGVHATNYGSGPDFQEFRLRRGLLEFVKAGQGYAAYRQIRTEGSKPRKKINKKTGKGDPRYQPNYFFEDLGKLLQPGRQADPAILSRHFRPQAGRVPGVFEVSCMFARKVLEMKQQQVEAIKALANQIAGSQKAEQYLDRLFRRPGLTNYISTLADISHRMSRAGEAPVSMETVLQAFDMTNEDEPLSRNGSLVRELILIRLIEALPQEKLSALPELQSETEERD